MHARHNMAHYSADLMNPKFLLSVFPSAALFALSGCAMSSAPAVNAVQAPALPTAPAASADHPSALSYGMVTGRVQKGVTTQNDIIELFGGPNTMTTDKDGTEVWMYDKTASTVSSSQVSSGAQADKSEARVMAEYFGIPFVAGIGGANASSQSQSAQVAQSQGTVTHSIRNITFIIKFNPDKTVKDYSVRQSSY